MLLLGAKSLCLALVYAWLMLALQGPLALGSRIKSATSGDGEVEAANKWAGLLAGALNQFGYTKCIDDKATGKERFWCGPTCGYGFAFVGSNTTGPVLDPTDDCCRHHDLDLNTTSFRSVEACPAHKKIIRCLRKVPQKVTYTVCTWTVSGRILQKLDYLNDGYKCSYKACGKSCNKCAVKVLGKSVQVCAPKLMKNVDSDAKDLADGFEYLLLPILRLRAQDTSSLKQCSMNA